jgi:hypothetical protein
MGMRMGLAGPPALRIGSILSQGMFFSPHPECQESLEERNKA